MKTLIAASLILGSLFAGAVQAQIKINTQQELDTAWANTHAASVICIAGIQRFNGPKLSDEQLREVILTLDEHCSTVMVGAYLMRGTALDMHAYATASPERQVQSSEIGFALKSYKELLGHFGYRPFPRTMEALLLMEINSR